MSEKCPRCGLPRQTETSGVSTSQYACGSTHKWPSRDCEYICAERRLEKKLREAYKLIVIMSYSSFFAKERVDAYKWLEENEEYKS